MPTPDELSQRIEELEGRLRATEAVLEIANLKSRYGQLADRRYHRRGGLREPAELEALATQIAALFSEDAVWDGGKELGVARGRKAIFERFREPSLEFSWHYFVKPQIHVDGDRARATWDILAPCTTADGRAHWMTGAEEDEYARINDVWLHTRLKLVPVFLAPYDEGWAPKR